MADVDDRFAFPSTGLPSRRVHVITYGCQMNVFDTRRMLQVLRPLGYEETDDMTMADLILLNTCSVREKPEQKVIGTITRLKPLKEARPGLVLGIGGCVGQQHGKALLDRLPYLDLVFGPDNIRDLPDMLASVEKGRQVGNTRRMKRKDYEFVAVEARAEAGPTAFLTIIKGCDKVCAFCIVPHVRGREISKPPDQVVHEVEALVARGVREVTLLGQNVNSYGKDRPSEGDFADLLARVSAVPGLARLRFVTSHPADADRRMMECFRRLPNLAEYLHLPIQSASDTVLKRMRRGYTVAEYLLKIEMARDACPDIALSTDFIVGFPGETREDFDRSMALIEKVRFDIIFSFKYSPRPRTRAVRMEDDVPENEKADRLQALQDLQDRIMVSRMERFLGRVEEVLVEGASRARDFEWMGRTRTNRVVNFPTSPAGAVKPGDLVGVRIEEVKAHSLRGRVEEDAGL
ncbi:MAG: tRNA (N6-isopentenyl adenosine(37)-C2)-methylthiotransferase MiaB [Deltaproteobacteria bacterium]|nr:tRNA (N6-isopentenyl adenosine(37)-C2)-methylthiotransferase MiaB [Deltaproteobacteria bacterium]